MHVLLNPGGEGGLCLPFADGDHSIEFETVDSAADVSLAGFTAVVTEDAAVQGGAGSAENDEGVGGVGGTEEEVEEASTPDAIATTDPDDLLLMEIQENDTTNANDADSVEASSLLGEEKGEGGVGVETSRVDLQGGEDASLEVEGESLSDVAAVNDSAVDEIDGDDVEGGDVPRCSISLDEEQE